MNTEYRKIYNKNYVILSECNIPDYKECYRSKMLKSNKLDNFLIYDTQTINGTIQFTYDISSKQSLYNFYENSLIDYDIIRHIIMSLKSAFDTLNNYLLEPDYIILDPKLIYINIATKSIYFCYCPGHKNNFYDSLSEFLCYILSKIDHNDNNSIILAYSLQQQSIQDNYTFDDLMQILNKPVFEHEKEPVPEEPERVCSESSTSSDTFYQEASYEDNPYDSLDLTGTSTSETREPITVSDNQLVSLLCFVCTFALGYCCFVQKLFSPIVLGILVVSCIAAIILIAKKGIFTKKVDKPADMETSPFPSKQSSPYHSIVTDIVNPDIAHSKITNTDFPYSSENLKSESTYCEDTVILGYRKTANTPQLIYTGTDFTSEVYIDCFPFVIGKMQDTVNMVIDNPMISRIHARIFLKEEHFYIEDMNSSNGTYINDTLIQPHTLTEIKSGDYITFAHLTYIFQ